MESLRKWFYKPKRGDTSLLAQFFYADEALNLIASELDSFDGRKDPSRCTTLVNQLRYSQDKVLTITNAIMDVLIGEERANRDFRVKFPEDVLQENLAGQLWFGAECLAAGSSIMNKEAESTEMRPLAKAVTKSLENVRTLLRDTCLRNNIPNGPIKLDSNELVTEMLLESLKIFDKLFADFELAYVSAMVPVKSTHEYELQELISVLFSETLQRSLKMKLLTQEMVDDCDPALMFTIPRLAIISGLLIYPSGPLCIDRPVDEMSSMYRPFRTLLHKIRELLWTLSKRELYKLEKLLCDNNEQIQSSSDVVCDFDNIDTDCGLDEFIEEFYSDYHNLGVIHHNNKDNTNNFYNNNNNNNVVKASSDNFNQYEDAHNLIDAPSTSSGYLIPNSIAHDIIVASISNNQSNATVSGLDSPPDHDSLEVISVAAATLSSILTTTAPATTNQTQVDKTASPVQKNPLKSSCNDLDSPNDSGICTENTSLDRSPSLDCQCKETTNAAAASTSSANCKCERKASPRKKKLVNSSPSNSGRLMKTDKIIACGLTTFPIRKRRIISSGAAIARNLVCDEDSSSVGSSDTTSSFNSNCADDEEIALAMQAALIASRNEIRAKYKSSADLLHRLYVCIAGVADQLQTNFASDLRNILKAVFLMNCSPESVETGNNELLCASTCSTGSATTLVTSSVATSATPATTPNISVSNVMMDSQSLDTSLEYRPSEDEVIENNEFSVDPNILAQEALFDTNVYFHLDGNLGGLGDDNVIYSNHPRQHHHQINEERNLASDLSRYASIREDFANLRQEQQERQQDQQSEGSREVVVVGAMSEDVAETPPMWIPDVEAPKCMSCGVNFTVVKRRHHCRNCGKVFCARCSSNSVPLPKFGHHKPVRVCNRCFIYNLTPFTM